MVDKKKCPCCGHEGDPSTWTHLEVKSSDGYASLVAYQYRAETKRRISVGSATLYACPECRSITWGR